ncbi:hypothetical protein MHYP_G00241850 [Metynnis hypsauchen]
MFNGVTNNRAKWKALADVHEAKMKALEEEQKKLEDNPVMSQARNERPAFYVNIHYKREVKGCRCHWKPNVERGMMEHLDLTRPKTDLYSEFGLNPARTMEDDVL